LPYAITWLDVFTSVPLAGNGLAVVHGADGVQDATMLAFARETRLSETTFVQTATDERADYRNRIWTTPGEIPFAGHPSLGTAVAVAYQRGETSARYVQQTGAGCQPIEVELHGHAARASMLQEPASFGPEPDLDDVLHAAGLSAGDAHPTLVAQVVSTGVPHLIAPVREDALARAAPPSREILRALLEPLGAIALYLAAIDPGTGAARTRGFFVDHTGITEDPGTGSAAGPLLAYLRERAGTSELTIEQGVQIGRPSKIECSWEQDRPRVAGDVVVVAEGRLLL
jgi:trans-2,3-dihydro-3-hydroxyanthranilate isomerase